MNEPNPRITKIVAKMIQAIHARPRQSLGKITAADAEGALAELDGLDQETARKQALDAKATERYFGAEDLRKSYESTGDPLEKIVAIHESGGHPVLLGATAEKGTALAGVIPRARRNERFEKAIISKFKND